MVDTMFNVGFSTLKPFFLTYFVCIRRFYVSFWLVKLLKTIMYVGSLRGVRFVHSFSSHHSKLFMFDICLIIFQSLLYQWFLRLIYDWYSNLNKNTPAPLFQPWGARTQSDFLKSKKIENFFIGGVKNQNAVKSTFTGKEKSKSICQTKH